MMSAATPVALARTKLASNTAATVSMDGNEQGHKIITHVGEDITSNGNIFTSTPNKDDRRGFYPGLNSRDNQTSVTPSSMPPTPETNGRSRSLQIGSNSKDSDETCSTRNSLCSEGGSPVENTPSSASSRSQTQERSSFFENDEGSSSFHNGQPMTNGYKYRAGSFVSRRGGRVSHVASSFFPPSPRPQHTQSSTPSPQRSRNATTVGMDMRSPCVRPPPSSSCYNVSNPQQEREGSNQNIHRNHDTHGQHINSPPSSREQRRFSGNQMQDVSDMTRSSLENQISHPLHQHQSTLQQQQQHLHRSEVSIPTLFHGKMPTVTLSHSLSSPSASPEKEKCLKGTICQGPSSTEDCTQANSKLSDLADANRSTYDDIIRTPPPHLRIRRKTISIDTQSINRSPLAAQINGQSKDSNNCSRLSCMSPGGALMSPVMMGLSPLPGGSCVSNRGGRRTPPASRMMQSGNKEQCPDSLGNFLASPQLGSFMSPRPEQSPRSSWHELNLGSPTLFSPGGSLSGGFFGSLGIQDSPSFEQIVSHPKDGSVVGMSFNDSKMLRGNVKQEPASEVKKLDAVPSSDRSEIKNVDRITSPIQSSSAQSKCNKRVCPPAISNSVPATPNRNDKSDTDSNNYLQSSFDTPSGFSWLQSPTQALMSGASHNGSELTPGTTPVSHFFHDIMGTSSEPQSRKNEIKSDSAANSLSALNVQPKDNRTPNVVPSGGGNMRLPYNQICISPVAASSKSITSKSLSSSEIHSTSWDQTRKTKDENNKESRIQSNTFSDATSENRPSENRSQEKRVTGNTGASCNLDVHMAERDLMEDEDLSVLLKLAASPRPSGGGSVFRSPAGKKQDMTTQGRQQVHLKPQHSFPAYNNHSGLPRHQNVIDCGSASSLQLPLINGHSTTTNTSPRLARRHSYTGNRSVANGSDNRVSNVQDRAVDYPGPPSFPLRPSSSLGFQLPLLNGKQKSARLEPIVKKESDVKYMKNGHSTQNSQKKATKRGKAIAKSKPKLKAKPVLAPQNNLCLGRNPIENKCGNIPQFGMRGNMLQQPQPSYSHSMPPSQYPPHYQRPLMMGENPPLLPQPMPKINNVPGSYPPWSVPPGNIHGSMHHMMGGRPPHAQLQHHPGAPGPYYQPPGMPIMPMNKMKGAHKNNMLKRQANTNKTTTNKKPKKPRKVHMGKGGGIGCPSSMGDDNNSNAAALAAAILRGVTMRPSGKWQAQLYYAGKSRYIGVFDTREKAALAYEIAREKLKSDPTRDTSNQDPKVTEEHVNMARKAAFAGVQEPQLNKI